MNDTDYMARAAEEQMAETLNEIVNKEVDRRLEEYLLAWGKMTKKRKIQGLVEKVVAYQNDLVKFLDAQVTLTQISNGLCLCPAREMAKKCLEKACPPTSHEN